jgi:tol-pal system protein YbgF
MTVVSMRAVLFAATLVVAAPSWAQRQSLADRVAALEQSAANQNQSSSQANVELINRLTQLQSDVQSMRGLIEQLQNENEQLKQRNREQYVDLDTRLQRLEGGGAATAAPAAPTPRPATAPVPTAPVAAPADTHTDGSDQPASNPADEAAAYGAAFDSLKRGDYVESARAFKIFLDNYPQAQLAPNAWYWLGESYYVTQNYPVALDAFQNLLAQFPDSGKAPDALLKKGYCLIEMKRIDAGQQTLQQVIQQYPGSDAANLADNRLRELSLDQH